MKAWIPLAVILALLVSSVVLAETMYARTSATVREGKTLGSPVVARLGQGDAVDVKRKSGRHYEVSVGGKAGWVYYNKLTSEKPEDVAALLSRSTSQPIELTDVEAGGALRGLSPMAEDYAKSSDIPGWARGAVEDMQGLSIAAEELEAFAREGRLGEYGEGE
jgi:hypothetical protein